MVCLETSFIIDVLRGESRARVALDRILESIETTTIASQTIMEVRSGIALNKHAVREKDLLRKVKAYSIILQLDDGSATRAGDIEAELIEKGELIPPVDIMIAAIALQHNEVLLTRNEKHFSKISRLQVETY